MKTLLSDAAEPKADAAEPAAGKRELSGDVLAIRGGRPLTGRVEVKGAKNLVTKAMVAALLGETPSVLRDVPDISDVQVVRSLLEVHGVRVEDGDEEGTLHLDPAGAVSAHFEEIDAHAGASRIPILFCGPLLHLLGEALIPDLGGCRIGDRPINFHMDALRAFGAVVDKSYEGIRITAPHGLHGAAIALPYPSVGATEQVLLTAVRAKGTTELRNAAIEPEIMDLIAVLQKMGAIISYEPNRVILIEGVESLRGYDHRAIFDRNEAASWACAALATDGDIFVGGAKQQEMLTFLNVFRKVGGWFDIREDGIQFRRDGELKPVVVETDVHPGFMTDWQQPLIVALTQAQGRSVVHETVYENRLGFTEALVQMGADIVVHPQGIDSPARRVPRRALEQAAVVMGPTPLHGAEVEVPDLRGGYSYVIAALAAEGESIVSNVGIIRRGYEKFFAKLDALGADFDVIG
jgi:UDP-N-acetylglucosamine 1-carboxyvinyltransferase